MDLGIPRAPALGSQVIPKEGLPLTAGRHLGLDATGGARVPEPYLLPFTLVNPDSSAKATVLDTYEVAYHFWRSQEAYRWVLRDGPGSLLVPFEAWLADPLGFHARWAPDDDGRGVMVASLATVCPVGRIEPWSPTE